MNTTKQQRSDNKKRQDNLYISINGHKKRIQEQKKAIKEAKKSIKMHRLLIKQAKIAAKLEELEK